MEKPMESQNTVGLAEALRARPDLVVKVAAVIEDGLSATTWRWSKEDGKTIVEPDWRERREMAKLILSYVEGLPVQRLVTASVEAGQRPDLMGLLKRSPNARRILDRMIESLPTTDQGQ